MTLSTVFDHLVVIAPTLDVGATYVQRHLGVLPQAGGAHVKMGTHNRLLRLDETTYLEVIAIDPAGAPPSRPRWFGLDRLSADAPATLGAWVARTSDIRLAAERAGEDLGSIATMTRGDLTWLISIPRDGDAVDESALDRCAPTLIEWQGDVHPASRLPDAGLRLVKLELRHPDPEHLRALFAAIDLRTPTALVRIEPGAKAHLVATIDTPQGLRTIASV